MLYVEHLTGEGERNRTDLAEVVAMVRLRDPSSIVECLDNFLRVCGQSISTSIEKTRKNNLIYVFAKAYGQMLKLSPLPTTSSSALFDEAMPFKVDVLMSAAKGIVTGSSAIGRAGIELIADLSFSLILLAQVLPFSITDSTHRSPLLILYIMSKLTISKAFHKGIYFDETLFQDFFCRINAIEVDGVAQTVPELLVREMFDRVKVLETTQVNNFVYSIIQLLSPPSAFGENFHSICIL